MRFRGLFLRSYDALVGFAFQPLFVRTIRSIYLDETTNDNGHKYRGQRDEYYLGLLFLLRRINV